jgi:hypothetical protein
MMPEGAEVLYDQPVLALDLGQHTAAIRRADMDQAGHYTVTGSEDKTVRVWSITEGRCLRTIRLPAGVGSIGKVFAVAISPDGTLIAAGGWMRATEADPQEQIYLFDRSTGGLVARIANLPTSVLHLTFSPDGNNLVAMLGRGLRAYAREAGWAECAHDPDYGEVSYGAAFAWDGRLATTSWDGRVRLYDPAFRLVANVAPPGGRDRGFIHSGVRLHGSPRVRTPIRLSGSQPFNLAFSPDGDRLVVGYSDVPDLDLLDGHSLEPLRAPDTRGIDGGNLAVVAWSGDGGTLYAGGSYTRAQTSLIVAWPDAGRGRRRELPAGRNSVMSLVPLRDGGLFVATADPYLAIVEPDGAERWAQRMPQANFIGQDGLLAVSADGQRVDFGFEYEGQGPARFDVTHLALGLNPPDDKTTTPPHQVGLDIEGWKNSPYVRLHYYLPFVERNEISRSLAVQHDCKRFILGTDWNLYAFAADGEGKYTLISELWKRPAPGVVRAVNITLDGRLVVAAYDDGTIRWHRIDDGKELLAFVPLADRTNWVVWTPEGFYAATPGAHAFLRWHVNHGWEPAESIPVADISGFYRPEVLPLVLQELETPRAVGLAVVAEQRKRVQLRTKSGVPPGARLHVLAIGISCYNEEHASHLRLHYALADARDIASTLHDTQDGLYAKVSVQYLSDQSATRASILRGLATLYEQMTGVDDMAVVHFSGHGAVLDDEFYLLPHNVDARDAVAIKDTALAFTALKAELMRLAQRGRVLVLVDACYSGATSFDGTASPDRTRTLSSALATSNITVLTSSGASGTSREDPTWGHGAFTKALLEGLSGLADENNDGLISTTELASYLDRRVRHLTAERQTPSMEVRFQSTLFAVGERL